MASSPDTLAIPGVSPADYGAEAPSRTPSPSSTEDPTSDLRDPHKPPNFGVSSLTSPSSPILYLPPLLSSLPPQYAVHSHVPSSARAPKTTETHLPDIDPASLALHKALHNFGPVTEDYANAPYAEAFNWDELELPEDEEREWYCVAFRSIRKEGSETGPLYEADKLAHEEAIQNGGLIMYWYGIPNAETGLNLATCIWQSRAHAIAANARPHHVRAMRLAVASYEKYSLERYRLRKRKGERGLEVLEYGSGEVGW